MDKAFERLSYVVKPLARSWIKGENPSRFKQELRFLMNSLDALEKMKTIHTGGVFHSPLLIGAGMKRLLNNYDVNHSVNVDGLDFKQRGQFLTALVAHLFDLEKTDKGTKKHEYSAAQIAGFLKNDERRIRGWKSDYAQRAINLLVRAGFISWEMPDWNSLSTQEKTIIQIGIEQIQQARIHDRLKQVGISLGKTRIGIILRKHDLSTDGQRMVAKVVMNRRNQVS